MKRLLHPLLLALIGVVALSAIVWWVAPMIGESHPLAPVWIRATIIALLFAMLAVRVAWVAWRRRRSNAALVAGMSKAQAPGDRELATLDERFKQALAILKSAPGTARRSLFGRGTLLYELPWYVFVGAPGSGKTTALLNAGLTFPLAEKMGAASVRGVGGTRNCDWWFTNDAVLIDTAGRYTTQDSDSGADAGAWDGFLALLRRSRPRRPINGVLLTVNIQDLLQQSPAERKEHAGKLRARMQELTDKLGVRAPVYVLVTKADLIAGFNESFAALTKEERNQVWGFTFPYAPKSDKDPLAAFDDEFSGLEAQLRARVVAQMDGEHEILRRAAIFNFPQQFASLRGVLGGFLSQVFSAGATVAEQPLLRGVYFTSGTQEGTPIDRVLGTLAKSFGIERRLAPPPATRGKSYFLHRLLKDVVFSEQGLVGENRAMERRRGTLRVAGYSAIAIVSVALVAGWAVSYAHNKAYVAEVAARLPALRSSVEALPPATSANVTPLPPVLDAVRNAARPAEFALESPPLTASLGLYQGGKLDAAAELGHDHLLEHALMPRVVRRLEERLRAANRNNLEDAYDSLKSYLMLYTPGKFDADVFKASVGADWNAALDRRLSAEQRGLLDQQLDAMVASRQPAPSVPLDPGLVAGVRDMLAGYPLEVRVFSRLKRARVGADLPPFTVASAAGPGAVTVFERASGEPLTKGIPGLYTRDGYRKAFQPEVDKATRQLAAEESWVLGLQPASGSRLVPGKTDVDLVNRVRRLYADEFIKTWDAYLADVRMVRLQSLEQSMQVARVMSSVDSPLAAYLRAVGRETSLVLPPAGAASGVAAQAEQKLAQATAGLDKLGLGDRNADTAALEQAVDDHFAPVRRLTAGTPAPIDETLRLMSDAYAQLAAVDAAQKSKSPPPAAGGAEKIKIAAAQQPEPARAMLEKLSDMAATSGRAAERAGLTSELKPIAEFCNRTITGRYPLATSAKADVLPEDFAQLFAPGGMLDDFYNRKLAALVDTGTNPWSFKPTGDGTKPVNAAALADFQRAARIKEVFFRGGGRTPGFAIDIVADPLEDGLKEVDLDIDGQVSKFLAGNPTPVTIQWPSARVASRIRLSAIPGTTPLVFEGPWALFRMFDRFDVQTTAQSERFMVPMNLDGRRARFIVTARSAYNPLRLRELQQFRCPGSL